MEWSKSVNEFKHMALILEHYVKEGVSELDDSKLPDLLELKYRAIANAKSETGDIQSIRDTFIGFQEHLYQSQAS